MAVVASQADISTKQNKNKCQFSAMLKAQSLIWKNSKNTLAFT